jgi:hypothetical protein
MRAIVALTLFLAPLFAAPALAAPATGATVKMPVSAQGVVLDANTGRPMGGVFVQQEGGLASAFTAAEGAFSITLDATAQPQLNFQCNGYSPKTVQVGNGKGLKVALSPLTIVTPGQVSSAPIQSSIESANIAPFDSRVAFGYRVRNETQSSDTSSVSGWANNDFQLGLRYRWDRYMLEGEGAHVQVPVDVTSLPRELNPAFTASTYEAAARMSFVMPLRNGWDTALGLGYRYKNTVPNNHQVPYIGNGADFEQTRHALGAIATAGWNSRTSPWGLEGSLAAYPLIYASAKEPGTPFGNQFGLEASAGLSYEIVRGLRLGLDYKFEGWHGNGDDTVHLLAARFFYTPVGLFKGNER